jgi:hypothetical protein
MGRPLAWPTGGKAWERVGGKPGRSKRSTGLFGCSGPAWALLLNPNQTRRKNKPLLVSHRDQRERTRGSVQ